MKMSNTTKKCLCLAGVFLFCLCPVFAQKGAVIKTVLRPRSYRLRTHQPKKAVERFNSSRALLKQVRMGGMSGLRRESLAPQPFDDGMRRIFREGLGTVHTGREVLPPDFIEELSPQTRQWYKATLQPNGSVGFVPLSDRLVAMQDEVAGAAEHGRILGPEVEEVPSPEMRQWYKATLQSNGSVGFVPVSGGLAALQDEVARVTPVTRPAAAGRPVRAVLGRPVMVADVSGAVARATQAAAEASFYATQIKLLRVAGFGDLEGLKALFESGVRIDTSVGVNVYSKAIEDLFESAMRYPEVVEYLLTVQDPAIQEYLSCKGLDVLRSSIRGGYKGSFIVWMGWNNSSKTALSRSDKVGLVLYAALDCEQFEMAKFIMGNLNIFPEEVLRYGSPRFPEDRQRIIDFLDQYKLEHP